MSNLDDNIEYLMEEQKAELEKFCPFPFKNKYISEDEAKKMAYFTYGRTGKFLNAYFCICNNWHLGHSKPA